MTYTPFMLHWFTTTFVYGASRWDGGKKVKAKALKRF